MKTGSQTIYYQFSNEKNLLDKADPFISKLRRMNGLSTSLYQVVKHELKTSDGKVIEEIYNRIEKHTRSSQLFYEPLDTSMTNMANNYNQLVNDIRFQYVTVYYDIIDLK